LPHAYRQAENGPINPQVQFNNYELAAGYLRRSQQPRGCKLSTIWRNLEIPLYSRVGHFADDLGGRPGDPRAASEMAPMPK
jgi:hypothetical protein